MYLLINSRLDYSSYLYRSHFATAVFYMTFYEVTPQLFEVFRSQNITPEWLEVCIKTKGEVCWCTQCFKLFSALLNFD